MLVREAAIKNLDDRGIVRVGAEVKIRRYISW